MFKLKLLIIGLFVIFGFIACSESKSQSFNLADSKKYEASLFRQNCAICHGADGMGKTLDDGKIVPSLRSGEFKFKTEAEIYKQIAEGGNGMTPFRLILSEREVKLMSEFVYKDLRGNK
jgi:cytochrome c553